jgi:hypothetical protein
VWSANFSRQSLESFSSRFYPRAVLFAAATASDAIAANEHFTQQLSMGSNATTANSQTVVIDENGIVNFGVRITNVSIAPVVGGVGLTVELIFNASQVVRSQDVTVPPSETKVVLLNHSVIGLTGGCAKQVCSVRVRRTSATFSGTVRIAIDGSYPKFTRRDLTFTPSVPQTIDPGQSRTFTFSLTGLGTTTTPQIESDIRARWTPPSVEIPPQGANPRPMNIIIRKPGGQIALQRDQTTSIDFALDIPAADLAAGGQWTIQFTNPGTQRIVVTSITGQIGHCFFN